MAKNVLIILSLMASAGTAFSGCATVSSGEYTSRWIQLAETETLQLSNGFTIRYLRAGEGSPLVLLHTIRTQLDYFKKLVPILSEHYQVYVPDLPGHGQSDIPRVEYTEEFFRKSIGEFITSLNLHDVTLAGESIGGVLPLTVSAELPDRISHTVALNPYDYGEKFGGGIRRSRNGWIIGFFRIFGFYTPETRFLLSAVLKGGFHDPSKLAKELVTEFHRTGKRSGYRRAEYSVFRNWQSWIVARDLYSRIEIPVTLVYSRSDWSRSEDRERTRLSIRDAKMITINDTGHFASLENPAKVSRIILSRRGK